MPRAPAHPLPFKRAIHVDDAGCHHLREAFMIGALRVVVVTLVSLLATVAAMESASAQGRNETLIVVVESGPNSMDIHGVGANRPAYQASWNLYDRLMTYGVKTLPDGSKMYDYAVLKPELAESWKHAAASDPWAMEWLKNNDAGSGAYKLESWKPGQETIYVRFDDWKSGPLPKLKRVIVREVPSAGNRRALLERGDADISFDLPPKDFSEMAKTGKVAVVSHPVENAFAYVGMNVKYPPFSTLKVRQAVAYAVLYEGVFSTAVFGRGVLLAGN